MLGHCIISVARKIEMLEGGRIRNCNADLDEKWQRRGALTCLGDTSEKG